MKKNPICIGHSQKIYGKNALFLALIIMSIVGKAQTIVSSNITGNVTWGLQGSPYRIYSNISVNNGAVLNIEPGVQVEFFNFTSLKIRGTIYAVGSSQAPISFKPLTTAGTWYGIRLDTVTNFKLSNCIFSGVGNFNPAIRIAHANMDSILNVKVLGGHSGILINNCSNLYLSNIEIRNLTSTDYYGLLTYGLSLLNSSGITIENSVIADNIFRSSGCAPIIVNGCTNKIILEANLIKNNDAGGNDGGVGGLNWRCNADTLIVLNNEFDGNRGAGGYGGASGCIKICNYSGFGNNSGGASHFGDFQNNHFVRTLSKEVVNVGREGFSGTSKHNVTFFNNVFEQNSKIALINVDSYSISNPDNIVFTSNIFENNQSGISVVKGKVQIKNNYFSKNTAAIIQGLSNVSVVNNYNGAIIVGREAYANPSVEIQSNYFESELVGVRIAKDYYTGNIPGMTKISDNYFDDCVYSISTDNNSLQLKRNSFHHVSHFALHYHSQTSNLTIDSNYFGNKSFNTIVYDFNDSSIYGIVNNTNPLLSPSSYSPLPKPKSPWFYKTSNHTRIYFDTIQDARVDSIVVVNSLDSVKYNHNVPLILPAGSDMGSAYLRANGTNKVSFRSDKVRNIFNLDYNDIVCNGDSLRITISRVPVLFSNRSFTINIWSQSDTIVYGLSQALGSGKLLKYNLSSMDSNNRDYRLDIIIDSVYEFSDTINFLTKDSPRIQRSELAVCQGSTASLSAPIGYTDLKWYRIQWGTPQIVASSIIYNATPGNSYYFTARGLAGCISYSDTVVVSTVSLPVPSAIPSITASVPLSYCSGSTFTLSHAVPANYVQTFPANNSTPPTVRWFRNDTLLSQTIYNSSSSQVFSITDSLPGTYELRIGSSTCFAQAQLTLTEKPNVEITLISKTDNLCFGDVGGQIVVSSPNATSYVWSSPALSNIPNNDTITNLPAGLYTLTAARSNGCSKTIQVQITQPPQIQLSTTTIQVSCHGGNDGILFLGVSNAVQPYSINWLSQGSSNDTITGLSAGSYSANVTDFNGCSVTGQFSVSQPNIISVQASNLSHVSCFGGQNGSVTASVIGGNGGYASTWRQLGGTSILSTSSSLSGSSAGTYRYKVVDSKGCADSLDVTINQPVAPLSASINSQVNVLCFGASTGSLSVQTLGGTIGTGYTYQWKNANNVTVSTSTTASGLPAGVYTCIVTDTKGCTTLVNGTILQPQSPVSVFTSGSTNISCFGGNNGAAWVQPTGGIAPYSYLWSNQMTNDTIVNLNSGNYSVTVTDNNGCSISQSFTVTQPTVLSNTFTKSLFFGNTNISCPNGTDGTIDLNPSGGTAPFTYLWSNSASTQNLNGVTAGTYTCTISDAMGCTSQAVVTMTDPNDHVWTTTVTDVSCNGDQNGAISMNIAGGNAPYRVNWNTSANNSGQTEVTFRVDMSQTQVSSLGVGAVIQGSIGILGLSNLYGNSVFIGNRKFNPGDTIFWRYFNGNNAETVPISCGAITSLSVFERYLVVPDHDTILPVICFSSCTNCSGVSEQGFDGTIQTASKTINKLGAGTYNFSLVDRNGCTSSHPVIVNQPTPLVAASTVLTNPTCPQNLDGAITIQATGGTVPYNYLWSNGATSSSISAIAKGNYWARVTDVKGCRDSLYFILTAPEPFDFEDICVLSVDSATGKNLIVWNKTPGQRTLEYRILKENAQGQFVQIGNQPYLNLSVFPDQSSNPQTQPDRYKIALVDSCGNSSDTSDFHRTIHLQSNLGSSGEVNLTWTPYLGKPVQSYELWRWITSGNLVQIATVAASVNSFTDLNPPIASNVYYVVNAVFPSSCSPVAGKNMAFDISRSNILNQTGIGFNENQALRNMRVYPNPNGGVFTVEFSNIDDLQSMSIIDGVGRVIRHFKSIDQTKFLLDLSDNPKGIYRINAIYSNGQANVPIVVH